MKLSLQLKLGQTLTMTPQLQQAIRLLQLYTLDLQQEIHQALESNPMLELDEGDDYGKPDASADPEDSGHREEIDNGINAINESYESADSASASSGEESQWEESHIPSELSVDSNWDDIYQTTYTTGSGSGSGTDSDFDSDFESRNSASETLQDHLTWQLNLTPMSDTDRLIGMAIIDAVDVNGMLTSTLESIHAGLNASLDIDLDEVTAVLHRIQQFDPVGVAYRDLAECLLIQLQQVDEEDVTPAVRNARVIVKNHLQLLGNRDYAQLMRLTRLKEPELRDAIAIIEALNPRPGADISPPSTTYIVPDVLVTKDTKSGRWQVELNPETAPRIRINPDYAALVRRADSSSDNSYLRD